MRLSLLLRPFASRNYRLYFFGQIVSLMGTWMSQTASLWLVYHLTGSAFLLGSIGFASQIPVFVLAPVAGVWIDRVDRQRLLLTTQIFSMLQSFALAYFTLTDRITVHHLLVLTLAQGIINAFDMPCRQALTHEFVENKEHLGSAIALNSSMFNLARLTGPAIGGFTIAAFGVGICYLIDGFSYLGVIVCIFAMRFPKLLEHHPRKHPLTDLREGFRFAFGFAPIRALILLVATVSLVGFSYSVLMPIFAKKVFGGDARTLGYLMSASGCGALMSAIYLGSRKSIRGLGKVITTGGIMMGIALVLVSISRWLPFSLFSLMIAGGGGVLLMAGSNTLLQAMVESRMRGRVMSLFTMAFSGTMPFGNLVIGASASRFGVVVTLVISGAICLAAAFVFWRNIPKLREAARPILEKTAFVQEMTEAGEGA